MIDIQYWYMYQHADILQFCPCLLLPFRCVALSDTCGPFYCLYTEQDTSLSVTDASFWRIRWTGGSALGAVKCAFCHLAKTKDLALTIGEQHDLHSAGAFLGKPVIGGSTQHTALVCALATRCFARGCC